jgi:predicted phage terminase large subunit-like protein
MVLACSHTQELADRFGRQVRNLVSTESELLEYAVKEDDSAARRWGTTTGGEYFAAGVGSSITGRRSDLAIIDDPVKSREAAESEVDRKRVWDWYRSDFYTRLKPGARIVLIMTRWHRDDLGGRLLAEAENGGDQWRVLKLPALAEENDPLGRAPGEPLWPEWENQEALDRKRAAVGERGWSALFQQNPRPTEGSLFKVDRIDVLDIAPTEGTICRAWDFAATAQVGTSDPDYSVGLKLLKEPSGRYVILDVVRFRGSPADVEARLLETAKSDGYGVQISIPQDPGSAGKGLVLAYTRLLNGFTVTSSPETGKKETRAAAVASQVEGRNFAMLRAAWNYPFSEELRDFPVGLKDDQVDALSRAFRQLMEPNYDTSLSWVQ